MLIGFSSLWNSPVLTMCFSYALQRACQRCALPAGGRDETTPLYRINFKPHKLLENAPTPTSRMHAVLGVFVFCKTHHLEKRHHHQLNKILTHKLIFGNNQKTSLARMLSS